MVFLFFTKKQLVFTIYYAIDLTGVKPPRQLQQQLLATRCLSRLFLTIPRNTFLCLDLRAIKKNKNCADCMKTEYVNNESNIHKVRAHGSIN